MTIGITGPGRREPWRGAIVALLRAAIAVVILLILLRLLDDFLVDWLWFSAVGYAAVFWTTIRAEAAVFFTVFAATATVLWVNGWLAFSFARRRWAQFPVGPGYSGNPTPLNPFKLIRGWLRWPLVITGTACVAAALVAWAELGNWYVFLELLYRVPYGADDPLFNNDIGFYLFSLPAWIAQIAASACQWFGVAMLTASMLLSSSIFRRSV